MRRRQAVVAALACAALVAWAATAVFPGGRYDWPGIQKRCHGGAVNAWGVCVDSGDCSAGIVCSDVIVPEEIDQALEELQAVTEFLVDAGGTPLVWQTGLTSAQVAANVTNETGVGALVLAQKPLLDRPRVQSYTHAGGLPAVDASNPGNLLVITDGSGSDPCNTGGGSLVVLCRDTGSARVLVGAIPGTATTPAWTAANPAIAPTDDNLEIGIAPCAATMVDATCHCIGPCTGPAAQLVFSDRSGNALTLSSTLACGSGTGDSSPVTFAASQTLNQWEGFRYSVDNTPGNSDRHVLVARFQCS